MKFIKKYLKTLILCLIAVLILFFETNSVWVERYYSVGLYPTISSVLRTITGWIPISVGDVLYVSVGLLLVYRIYSFVKKITQKLPVKLLLRNTIASIVNSFLIVYILFELMWGLNYSRQGIAQQLDMKETVYCKEDVEKLLTYFIFEANKCRRQIADTGLPVIATKDVFNHALTAYKKVETEYHFLTLQSSSIKPSLMSFTGNYLGYTGYYNPFTGEAQVRNDIPDILLPFIACHEMAHQLGYAGEDEANFVAFLVAEKSDDIYLRYSMCLEMIDYTINDLFLKYYEDFDLKNFDDKVRQLYDRLEPGVRNDRKNIKIFFKQNKKDISKISTIIYDKYLKINNKNVGIASYNGVVELVFRYFSTKS